MSNLHTRYSREWFRESWKRRIIAWTVIWIVGFACIVVFTSEDNNARSEAPVTDKIELTMFDGTPRQFVNRFKDGRFGRTPSAFTYSASFKRTFLNKARDKWYQTRSTSARGTHPTSGYPGDAWIWNDFRNHDTCDSPLINAPDCNYRGNNDLLKGSYWEQRRDAQDKWMLRIVFCGSSAVGVVASGGSTAFAIGHGASMCFAGFYVD